MNNNENFNVSKATSNKIVEYIKKSTLNKFNVKNMQNF